MVEDLELFFPFPEMGRTLNCFFPFPGMGRSKEVTLVPGPLNTSKDKKGLQHFGSQKLGKCSFSLDPVGVVPLGAIPCRNTALPYQAIEKEQPAQLYSFQTQI